MSQQISLTFSRPKIPYKNDLLVKFLKLNLKGFFMEFIKQRRQEEATMSLGLSIIVLSYKKYYFHGYPISRK